MPFVQTVITFDKRLLDLELPGEQVILGDQRRLVVDSFTVFRIVDPLLLLPVGRPGGGRHPRPAQLDRVGLAAPGACQQQAARRAVGQARPDHGDDPRPGERRDEGLRRSDRGRAHPPRRPAGREHQGDPGRACSPSASASQRRRAPRARRRRSASAPTPTATGRCCWPRRAPPPTGCAARARREATRIFANAYQQDTGLLLDLAHAAGLSGRVRDRQLAAGSYPRTTISCAIFSPRRRQRVRPVASRRAPDHIPQDLQGTLDHAPDPLPLCPRRHARPCRGGRRAARHRAPTSRRFARAAPDSFADLAAKLLPAVVNISSTQAGRPGRRAGDPGRVRRFRCSRLARRSSSSSRTSSTATGPAARRARRPAAAARPAHAEPGVRLHHRCVRPGGDQQPRDRRRRRDHRHPAGQHLAEGQGARAATKPATSPCCR